jgi:hypothetical protein
MSVAFQVLLGEHYGRRKGMLFYTRWCYSTHCKLFHVSKQGATDKSQIIACKVSRFKSQWFLPVEKPKIQVYSNNLHTLDELRDRFSETVTSVAVSEIKLVSNSLFKRLEVCLRAERRHFEHLL